MTKVKSTKFYIEMFDGDYVYSEKDRVTGKDETVYFNSYDEANDHIKNEGFADIDFDIYEVDEND